MSDILRLKAVLRRVPLGKTKFLEDYVQHNESDVFVPHTDGEVRRVRPVPLEPTLDVEASLAIVEATHGFVDLYKVGRANYMPMTKTTDWRDYTLRMLDTLNRVDARFYIKRDLQPFLPAGIKNTLRVPQHH